MINSQYSPSSRSIQNKLLRLSMELEQRVSVGNLSTQDEFFAAVNEALWEFYTYLQVPQSERLEIKHRDTLSPTVLLTILKAALNDIQEGYDRIGETQDEILRRNNRYASSMRDILARIQHANNITASVSRVLEDNTYEVSDSFADETLLDGPGPGGKQMYVNGQAGILSLAQLITNSMPVSTVKILNSSNGAAETTHPLSSLTDGNLDTWFEYRRSGELDTDPLTLEILVTLQTVQIINQIQIFPLGLDDRAFSRVIDISTSLDGKAYESIRSSIPTFLSKEEEDALFILGPVGFRNQDHSDFTFTPRTCQYIRIKIQQGKRVQLGTDQVLRIALRDIKVNQIEYDEAGETTTKTFPLGFSPRKLKLIERAVETSPLTTLTYQVSFDDGAQWYDVVAGQDTEVNTGTLNSLDVPGTLSSIKLKIMAARDRTKFNGLARPLAGSIRTITDRIGIDGIPTSLTLANIPLENSLLVSRPVASVGTDFAYPLQRANGEIDLVVDLPIAVRPFSEILKVNGQAWTRVANFNEGTPSDRTYTIDYINGQIKFSDARYGMVPEGELGLQLDAEQVLLPDSSPFVIDLENAHDFNAEHTAIYWYDRPRATTEEALSRGTTKFQLANYPIVQTLDIVEEVPPNVASFYLKNIPTEGGLVLFSDKVKFGTLVEGTPAAAGEYSITPLVSGVISPLLVQVYGTTNTSTPGTASLEARGRVVDPQVSYDPEAWLQKLGYPITISPSGVEVYSPRFSDTNVFKAQKTFIDGATELTQAGDYSIDHENGAIYSFSTTQEQGVTYIVYGYQNRRPLNWSFVPDNPKQLVIADDSFLVTRNDQFPITIFDTELKYVVYKDNRYVRIPVNYLSVSGTTYTDNAVKINFDTPDYIRGYILPAGRTRVVLPHQSLVRNSTRFFFLSNDTDAYDDRNVIPASKSDSGVLEVNPKPIRDVYGNTLDGISADARTQRDVDKLAITRERPFVDGRRELERGGDYSVDYRNGVLYTYVPIPLHTMIQYEYSDVRVTYVATQVLQADTQYTLETDNLTLTINSVGGQTDLAGSELLVRYDIIDQLREDPVRIYRHYSPLLLGYQLKIKP